MRWDFIRRDGEAGVYYLINQIRAYCVTAHQLQMTIYFHCEPPPGGGVFEKPP
jgi:hypothetical protein